MHFKSSWHLLVTMDIRRCNYGLWYPVTIKPWKEIGKLKLLQNPAFHMFPQLRKWSIVISRCADTGSCLMFVLNLRRHHPTALTIEQASWLAILAHPEKLNIKPPYDHQPKNGHWPMYFFETTNRTVWNYPSAKSAFPSLTLLSRCIFRMPTFTGPHLQGFGWK